MGEGLRTRQETTRLSMNVVEAVVSALYDESCGRCKLKVVRLRQLRERFAFVAENEHDSKRIVRWRL